MARHLSSSKLRDIRKRNSEAASESLPCSTAIIYRRRIFKKPYNEWRGEAIEVTQRARAEDLRLDRPVIFTLTRSRTPAERRQRGFLPPMKRA